MMKLRVVDASKRILRNRAAFRRLFVGVQPDHGALRHQGRTLGLVVSSSPSSPLLLPHCRTSARWHSFLDFSVEENTTTPFLLADIGEGIKEVELLQWYVETGDTLQQFDTVCQVQSDKATVEITSRYDGKVLQLCGAVGDMIQVGEPLLYLQTAAAGDESSSSTFETTSKLEEAQPLEDDERLRIPTVASHYRLESDDDTTAAVPAGSRSSFPAARKYQASPAVRKLGADHGIDLSVIHGSGPQGRLLKSDVVTYLQEQGLWRATTTAQSRPAAAIDNAPQSPPATTTIAHDDEESLVQPIRGYHRLMLQTMTASLQIPHMCFADEWDVGRLLEFRKQLNHATSSNEESIGLLPFFVKACSLALMEYPALNAVYEEHAEHGPSLRLLPNHDIGLAMDTPRGLVVPVIRNVQQKSLADIQADLTRLKQAAAELALTTKDLTGATFTLSNIGTLGGTYMSPVIVSPQMAMGALGQVQRLPRFANADSVELIEAQIMNVSWAGDHRYIDGATLARFNARMKQLTQDPIHMLAQLI